MHLYPIDGAACRVAADATAFLYRDGGWAGVIVGVDPDPANAGLIAGWAQDYWRALPGDRISGLVGPTSKARWSRASQFLRPLGVAR